MRKSIFALLIASLAAPAHATGGFVCRTAGDRQIEVSVGFGHVPGTPLTLTRLLDGGRDVPVAEAQWWLDDSELRLLLINPESTRQEVKVEAKRNGHTYDGSLWRNGWQQWVRCREA